MKVYIGSNPLFILPVGKGLLPVKLDSNLPSYPQLILYSLLPTSLSFIYTFSCLHPDSNRVPFRTTSQSHRRRLSCSPFTTSTLKSSPVESIPTWDTTSYGGGGEGSSLTWVAGSTLYLWCLSLSCTTFSFPFHKVLISSPPFDSPVCSTCNF